ncbi:Hypothetical protein, putative [Bodo saltans]|uniref:NYN domain-containing protein n=1 Tax=Bodo saltans TaxID=75058 RepID=A0A0S4IQ48_BODSA|nr:Hypothetical protein, putative [Bodo saltans]|eukprot:CUF92731.1 Hypothetical protein, putative [Bodo saltans]
MNYEDKRRAIARYFPSVDEAILHDLLDSFGGDLDRAVATGVELFSSAHSADPPPAVAVAVAANTYHNPRQGADLSPVLAVANSTPFEETSNVTNPPRSALEQLQRIIGHVSVGYLRELLAKHDSNVNHCLEDYFANGIVEQSPETTTSSPPPPPPPFAASTAPTSDAQPQQARRSPPTDPVDIISGMFAVVPRSIIAGTLVQANGDMQRAVDIILNEFSEEAPPAQVQVRDREPEDFGGEEGVNAVQDLVEQLHREYTLVQAKGDMQRAVDIILNEFSEEAPLAQVRDREPENFGGEEGVNAVQDLVEQLHREFPIFERKLIRKTVNRILRNGSDNLENIARKELQQKEKSRAHYLANEGSAQPTGGAFCNEEQLPPQYSKLLPSPLAVLPRAMPSTASSPSTSSHCQFHIFWDFDNRQQSRSSVGSIDFLERVKQYFQFHAVVRRQPQQLNPVFVEVFITGNSRISHYEINSLRDLTGKIVMCSPKPGDADRQIARAVRDLLSWGLDPQNHHIVIISSDKDFTDCAEGIRRAGFTAWCVHEAILDSGHDRILKSMYDKCVHLDEIIRKTAVPQLR